MFMHVKTNYETDTRVKLTIAVDPKELQSYKEHVLRHLNTSHVKIAGFRPGKAPLHLVEKNADPGQLQTEFLDEAINSLYKRVIEEENLRPIEQPQVSIKKFVPFTELEFDADVEVVGKITVGDYKKIKKTKLPVMVDAEAVNEVIEALRKRLAAKKEVKRAAKDGDEVILDFRGVDDKGNPVNGADGKEFPLVLGSNTFIPGFEPNLIGLSPNEEKTFTVTFPKDYGVAALQNKKVTFAVRIHKVQEMVLPKTDDTFAAQAGPFKTLADLKKDIKQQLVLERSQEGNRAFENEVLVAVAEKSDVEIPKALVDDQIERSERDERQNLTYRGQTWQEHLEEEGITEEEHRERNRATAEQSVKMGLILSEIATLEGIEVTPEELEVRIQLLKGQYQDLKMREELDKPEAAQDIINRLMTEKTLAQLVNYATH
jgi:trigger factor